MIYNDDQLLIKIEIDQRNILSLIIGKNSMNVQLGYISLHSIFKTNRTLYSTHFVVHYDKHLF